jgi:hypothetical protein
VIRSYGGPDAKPGADARYYELELEAELTPAERNAAAAREPSRDVEREAGMELER